MVAHANMYAAYILWCRVKVDSLHYQRAGHAMYAMYWHAAHSFHGETGSLAQCNICIRV